MGGAADSPFVLGEAGYSVWGRYRDLGTARRYPAGAHIYRQGEGSDRFFYLVSGRVKVYMGRPDGSELTLSIMDAGTTFGESACFDGSPYYASALALQPCAVIVFPRQAALQVMARDPEVAAATLRGVIRKQRLLATQLESMAFLKAPARVALMLHRLATDYGAPVPGGAGTRFTLRLTHAELASMLGTSRVTVSRVIGALIRSGILSKQKWELIVLDPERLRELARA